MLWIEARSRPRTAPALSKWWTAWSRRIAWPRLDVEDLRWINPWR